MDSMATIENCQKELHNWRFRTYTNRCGHKHRLQEKFEAFKEKLRQLTMENKEQKEKIQF